MSSAVNANADPLLYLQECLTDLQNRFYGLQLEQFSKQQTDVPQMALPSLNNSIWSQSSQFSRQAHNRSDLSTSGSERDSPFSHISQQIAQIQHMTAPQSVWAPLLSHGQIITDNKVDSKKSKISPIGTGKPTNNQSQSALDQYRSVQSGHSTYPFGTFSSPKHNQKGKQMNKSQAKPAKQSPNKSKQGPYNKVLIVGLAPEYRSLNGVLDIFRPYGDVVSARVYRPYLTLPPEITRWVPSIELQGVYCAIVEYPTARCAKFAVGVLRERVQSNKYRVVLLKPGAYEELQRQQAQIDSVSAIGKTENISTESNSDSGNESFEQRSSRSSDCTSD